MAARKKGLILLLLILILAGTFLLVYNKRKTSMPQPPAGYHWNLALSDDFNGDTLNSKLWVTCYDWYDTQHKGCTNGGNSELEWYKSSQVSVKNGQLTLTATPQPTTGWNGSYEQSYPYVSGMISTGRPTFNGEPKWSMQYGYYEARISVTGGKGVWPAFWLLPVNHDWPPEIDIMELLGSTPDKVLMTYHWPGASGSAPQKDGTVYAGPVFTDSWHTYAVNWQPGRIDWYVDGALRKSYAGLLVTNEPMELILNLAIGGTLPGSPDASTKFPAIERVDYVRAYGLVKNQ
jgi:beta-glucanase (GH16 family)